MEEFSLTKWETGNYDVVTGEGKIGRIICTDIKNERSIAVILPTLDNPGGIEEMRTYYANGSYYGYGQSELDLMLVKKQWKPKEGDWFYYIGGDYMPMVYKSNFLSELNWHKELILMGNYFKTKKEAEKKVDEILEILKK